MLMIDDDVEIGFNDGSSVINSSTKQIRIERDTVGTTVVPYSIINYSTVLIYFHTVQVLQ